MLSHALLNPVISQIQNPFFSLVETIEKWLLENESEYLSDTWPKVKEAYVKRCLKVKNGSFLRGFSLRCQNPELAVTLHDVYQMLDHCTYYTSKLWRAFYYYLKTGQLNLAAWPQFGKQEADLVCSVLSQSELERYRIEAHKEWLNYYEDQTSINNLFKKLKKPIHNLCYKRSVNFLYDTAKYSLEDLKQYAFEAIIKAIRRNDYIPKNPDKIIGWSLKCADNAIHNQLSLSMSDGQRRTILDDDTGCHRLRLNSLSHEYLTEDSTSSATLDAKLLDDDVFMLTKEMENEVFVKELIEQADPKISSYLKFVCCGEHNPDFWTWFYYNEPTLVQRISYLEENPEAVAPYLQRHLELPTWQLTNFLRKHLPDILDKVKKPSTIQQLQYGS